jgi:hypothetical protein
MGLLKKTELLVDVSTIFMYAMSFDQYFHL